MLSAVPADKRLFCASEHKLPVCGMFLLKIEYKSDIIKIDRIPLFGMRIPARIFQLTQEVDP